MNFFITEVPQKKPIRNISVSTEFVSGGGDVKISQFDPLTLILKPHNERNGGWSQVWWYFKLEGDISGEEVFINLDIGEPKVMGLSPKVQFSYDQKDWGLTNSGNFITINGREFYVYNHIVQSNMVWFAYDLPYTPEHMELNLLTSAEKEENVEIFELCKSLNNRPVRGLKFRATINNRAKYGIWLQARTHSFESGSSWVIHKLAEWLMSDDVNAKALRECADITIIPILDIDGVVEGRTGKLQSPYDHNRGWNEKPSHWPEVKETQKRIQKLASENMADMFIDFHGPGNQSHPYFIVPASEILPYKKQRGNRSNFFEVLNAKPLTKAMMQTQSMTQIAYSSRTFDRISKDNSA